MSKNLKVMSDEELVEEFESAVVRAEKVVYTHAPGIPDKRDELSARVRELKMELFRRFAMLKLELRNAKNRENSGTFGPRFSL